MFNAIIIGSVLVAGALANYPYNNYYQDNVIDLNGWTIEPRIPIDIGEPQYTYADPKIEKPIVYEFPSASPTQTVVVPKPTKQITEIISMAPAQKVGLITSIISGCFSGVKLFFKSIFTKLPALMFGVVGAIALCKFTTLCQLSTIQSFIESKNKMFANVASDKISAATNLFRQAMKTYESL